MSSSAFEAQAPIFAALGDETRLALLSKLTAGPPQSIARLTDGSSVTRQAITKHLRVLQGAGLVRGMHRGRETVFELLPQPLIEARQALESISQMWDQALERLQAHVAEGDPLDA